MCPQKIRFGTVSVEYATPTTRANSSGSFIDVKMHAWFYNVVCPVVGMLLSNAMFAVPLMVVQEAREKRDLGELNPMPWVAGKKLTKLRQLNSL
jgi:hypothetical protein